MQKFAETRIIGTNSQQIGGSLDINAAQRGTNTRILTDVTQPRNSPTRTRVVRQVQGAPVRRNPVADVLNTNTNTGNIGGGGINR